MAGDSGNVGAWLEADVFTAPVGTTFPTDINDDWAGWDLVGLLDGADGFVHSRSEDKTDLFAWGGVIVRTRRKNFKATVKFSALEENETTFGLEWPGSAYPAGPLIVPRPGPVLIGLELREDLKVKRLISTDHAEVDLDGDKTENEDTLAKKPFIATIFPNGDGEIWTPQDGTQAT